jgi:hypothetical protein
MTFLKIYSTGVALVASVVSGACYFRLDVCNLFFKITYNIWTLPKLKAELVKRGVVKTGEKADYFYNLLFPCI